MNDPVLNRVDPPRNSALSPVGPTAEAGGYDFVSMQPVIEDTEDQPAPSPRPRAFILLRFTLIITTGYLLLAEIGPTNVGVGLVVLLGVVFVSNIAILFAPPAWTHSAKFTGAVVVGDTVWITTALLISGSFSIEFFYLYFFVLFLAAVGENLRLVALGVVVVCVTYAVLFIKTQSVGAAMATSFLIRLPFLFAVAVFFGFLVDRLRRETIRARGEHMARGKLEESHSRLQEANRALTEEIRERERIEQSLQQANDQLQELADMRSRFFTTVSHEVKTPVTSIKNSLKLVRSCKDPEKQGHFFDIIDRNANRLNLIISDVLDMARVETGSLRIRAESWDVGELARELVASSLGEAQAAGVKLTADLSPDAPRVWADRRRIKQVLLDLIDNALRVTDKGGSVVVRIAPCGDVIEVSVEDTGVGLNEIDQRRIFEPFYQAGDELVGRPPGAGLGLTICRDLTRGHGSDLLVESQLGVGSRFFFRLPVAGAKAAETIQFEEAVRTVYRKYPIFSVLVVAPKTGDPCDATMPSLPARTRELERLTARLEELLPREIDHIVGQPAHDRIVVLLLTIPRRGGVVVRNRLQSALAQQTDPRSDQHDRQVRVYGPACFPEDGHFGHRLINLALAHQGDEHKEEK